MKKTITLEQTGTSSLGEVFLISILSEAYRIFIIFCKTNNFKYYLFFAICLLLNFSVSGQAAKNPLSPSNPAATADKTLPVFFHKLGTEEDLPNRVSDVLRDQKGFLWINADDGIYRYDGIKIKKIDYNQKDSTAPVVNSFRHLFLGQSDTVWAVGGYSQLCYFDWATERFKTIPLNYENMEAPRLFSALEDSRGILWAAFGDHGLNRVNPQTGELSRTTVYEHLPKDFMEIHTIMEDSRGNIWGLSDNLFCLSFKENSQEIEKVTLYPELSFKPSPEQGFTLDITEDARGFIWVAGYEGSIYQVDPEKEVVKKFTDAFYQKEGNAPGYVIFLTAMQDGTIWMSIKNKGITIFNPHTEKFTHNRYNKFDPLSIGSNNVRKTYQDKEGIIWVPTYEDGLNYYNTRSAKFGHFRAIPDQTNALNGNIVQAFFEDSEGNIWIGTNEGLNKFNRQTGEFQQIPKPKFSLPNQSLSVYSIAEKPNRSVAATNTLWIGSTAGLLEFDPKTNAFSKLSFADKKLKPLETSQVRYFGKAEDGTIWINTYFPHHIFRYQKETGNFQEIELEAEKSDGIVDYVFLDDAQHFWLYSHQNGLYRLNLNTGEQTHFEIVANETGNFEPSYILGIWKDKKNRYWLGGSGLYLLTAIPNEVNKYTYEDFTERAGIPDGTVNGLINSNENEVWLSTSKGLVKMNPETLTFQNYQPGDGLQGKEFFFRALYKSPTTGDLYFGGLNGFNVFHPNEIKKDTTPPPVAITQVEIFRDSIMQPVNLEKTKNNTGIPTVELWHNDKILRIYFAALKLTAPQLNQYAIQMEGYDDDWRYLGDEADVTYTNLDAGDYTFKVKAANQDGFWNEIGTSVKVIVHPPWWATWWAYLVYSLLIASAIYFLYQFQLRRNIEKTEAAYLKKMDEVKTRFFTNITHEFRTPLTLILGPAQQLHDQESHPKKHKKLGGILKNATHVLELVNQLLDLSKLEGNQMQLEIRHGDLVEYTENFVNMIRPLAQKKEQNLLFISNQERWETNFDQNKWNKIIFNLLSNAIKFTQKGGTIELQLSQQFAPQQEMIHLAVKDNGPGIAEKDISNIFNRFHQVDASSTRLQEGTGIGLALVKELVELQNGRVEVQSKIGQGTTFIVEIPVIQPLEKVEKLLSATPLNMPIWIENEAEPIKEEPILADERLEILIVEDNKDMRQYIQSCLDATKYHILMANDGQEGIEVAFATIPDLIILDVMMPKKDGFEVVSAIREYLPTSHIPIVLLTAKAALESRLEGLGRGADAYLTKPFSPQELVIRVQKLIELRQAMQQRYQKQNHQEIKEETSEKYSKEDVFITQLKAYILENILDAELSVNTLSDHFFMSRTQLYRKIKALTDESAVVFIQKVRLEVALELMENNQQLSLSEIAYQTGFSSPSYFSTVFKKVYGKSPSERIE